MKKIEIIPMSIKGKDRFGLRFPYDTELIRLTKIIPGAMWDTQSRCWHVAMTQANFTRISEIYSNAALINTDKIKSRLVPSLSTLYQLLGSLNPVDKEKRFGCFTGI